MKQVTFNMEPFTCPSCITKIEKTIAKMEGIQTVKVMFNSGRVRVEFDEAHTHADALQSTIERLGYPVLSSKLA
ncbi:MAG: cation transporter [Alcaligenaceae bacterium]|nr:cation transporter [Alcaligenaceae bacterium]